MMPMRIQLKRVYEAPSEDEGPRILVERFCPTIRPLFQARQGRMIMGRLGVVMTDSPNHPSTPHHQLSAD